MKRMMISMVAVLALAAVGHGTALAQDDDDDPLGGIGDDDDGGGEAGGEASASASGEVGVNADTASKIGFGIASTLSGVVGGELEYHLGDKLFVDGVFALNFFSPSADGADSQTTIVIGGGAFYRLAGTGDTGLYLGGRLLLGNNDAGTQINLEGPLRIQVWLSDALALHFETGLVIAIVPEEGVVLPPGLGADTTVIAIGGNLFGSGGITIYWP